GPVAWGQAAGVAATRAYLAEMAPAGDPDRRQAVGGRTVAELAGAVDAPAVGQAVRGHATGVVAARAHVAKQEPADHRDRRQTQDGGRTVTELAVRVEAPAIGQVVRGHAAGVGPARAHLAERQRMGWRDV